MKLLDYQEPFTEVKAKTATGTMPLAVYGLSLEQAILLARDYGEHFRPVYAEVKEKGLTDVRQAEIIAELLTEIPACINMICYFGLRCEDENEMDMVAKMPAGLRIEIVEAAARMTFHSEAGAGKILGIAVNTFRAAAGMAAQNVKVAKATKTARKP